MTVRIRWAHDRNPLQEDLFQAIFEETDGAKRKEGRQEKLPSQDDPEKRSAAERIVSARTSGMVARDATRVLAVGGERTGLVQDH
jgi:hypothetical protein